MIEAREVFDKILCEEVEDGEILGDYIESEDLESYLVVFDKVPDTDKEEVLREFIELIFNYQSWTGSFMKKFYKERLPTLYGHAKPQREIDKDLNTLREYAAMIRRLYGLGKGGDLLMNIPEELSASLKTTKRLISDLENKEFNIIHRSKYYDPQDPTKTDLKAFLKRTRIKYNLNSTDAKQLLDAIKPI